MRITIDGADIVGYDLRTQLGRGCSLVEVCRTGNTRKKKYWNNESCNHGSQQLGLPVRNSLRQILLRSTGGTNACSLGMHDNSFRVASGSDRTHCFNHFP